MSELLVIQGTVSRGGSPVEAAYIDLLNDKGEFIAERRTAGDGTYSFHTTPGNWTLVCRTAGAEASRREVSSDAGTAEVQFSL